MKSFGSTVFFTITMAVLLINPPEAGNAATTPRVSASGAQQSFKLKAQHAERLEKWQEALYLWKAHLLSNPNDTDAAQHITKLRKTIRRKSTAHYSLGVSYYHQDKLEPARKELLTSLRIDPGNTEALHFLKTRFVTETHQKYEVKPKDTLQRISAQFYGDPQKDFVIAYFNDMDAQSLLKPGMELTIPKLTLSPGAMSAKTVETKPRPADKQIDIDAKIDAAEELLQKGQFDDVINHANDILDMDYLNARAENLLNSAYLGKGLQLAKQKKYFESLDILNKADPEFEGIQAAIAHVRKKISEVAEEHYRSGVKYFINEKLEKAIEEWQKTLELNPKHQKAKEDIQNAEELLEKLKKIN